MTVTRPPWLRTLADALADPVRVGQVARLRPGVGARAAAVLVLVGEDAGVPEILFVERSATLRHHAGQIAFPGGAADPGDADLVATALREAEEEVALDPAGVDVLGSLPPVHVAVSGFDVTAVVGWWRPSAFQLGSLVRAADPREVASVPIVPLAVLTDPAHRVSARHPSGYTGPAFTVGDHLIWGLTGHLLDGVLDLAGWSRPWDRTREASIPARYLSAAHSSGGLTMGGPDAH